MINTHFHADFLAGHLELAEATGAWIGYGARAKAEFPVRHLADGERIALGDVVLEIMETPGHTPESISVLVYEHAGDEVPYGVLTGDALFIGDVGRPDLLASIGHTADELGRMLYASVQPAHDAARPGPGLPRARRRLGLREEPLHRALVDDRRASGPGTTRVSRWTRTSSSLW